MSLLVQFILRLAFGLAAAMASIAPRQVTSGYFRNNLYVLLGLNVLATLVAVAAPATFSLALPLTAAIACYLVGVVYLYERPAIGRWGLAVIAVADLAGAFAAPRPEGTTAVAQALFAGDVVTGGWLLGTTMAAMLLGHWYLNSPTMALAPLVRLLWLMVAAVALRALDCGVGWALAMQSGGGPAGAMLLFLLLRWLAGILGTAGLIWMAGKTLQIPNTQSATGILYVAVIATFIGELVSLLLSSASAYPL